MKRPIGAFMAVAFGCVSVVAQAPGRKTAGAIEVSKAAFDGWMRELSNWGKWGKTDQRGTVNLITPEKVRAAAALVKEGFAVSLSRDADTTTSADNRQPFGHTMTSTGADPTALFAMDTFTISYHNQALTHLDSLSHTFYEGKVYNGYGRDEVGKNGARQLAVSAFKNGLNGRGVLMDIPRLKGVRYLELSTPITPEDFEAWEKQAGMKVGSGDIVFVRSGRWTRRAEKGAWDISGEMAGMHPACARWFHQRGVALVGSDGHGERMPSVVPGVAYPLHLLLLVAMGTPMFDNCDLEPLGEAAAARKRWTFLLSASPLAVPGGTGSPLNPIAIF
jgi:kynurenine formamidase